ncbi:MAG TPA: hypothetical protein VNU44_14715 [Bryobacteraceae bacterium]|jgi:hypothetical protein|nr:hypothetical protein [Bryobacteraceae bacterium]
MASASMPLADFAYIVNSAADQFESARQMSVTKDGRTALIEPAIPYQDHVDGELRAGKITIERLQMSVTEVLDNGYIIAFEEARKAIDGYVVRKSMKKYCPYIMWC